MRVQVETDNYNKQLPDSTKLYRKEQLPIVTPKSAQLENVMRYITYNCTTVRAVLTISDTNKSINSNKNTRKQLLLQQFNVQ